MKIGLTRNAISTAIINTLTMRRSPSSMQYITGFTRKMAIGVGQVVNDAELPAATSIMVMDPDR